MRAIGSPLRSRPTRPVIVDVGVQREEPDQLRADVAGGADDGDADRVALERAQPGAAAVGRGVGERRSAAIAAPAESALTGAPRPLAGGRLEGVGIGRNVVTS